MRSSVHRDTPAKSAADRPGLSRRDLLAATAGAAGQPALRVMSSNGAVSGKPAILPSG